MNDSATGFNMKADFLHIFMLIIITSSPWTRMGIYWYCWCYFFLLCLSERYFWKVPGKYSERRSNIPHLLWPPLTVAVNDQPADETIIDRDGACASWNIKYITSSQGASQAAALSPRVASGCSQEMRAAIRQAAGQSAGAASCRTRRLGCVLLSVAAWWLVVVVVMGGGLSQLEHPKHFNFKWRCNNSRSFLECITEYFCFPFFFIFTTMLLF